MNVSFSFDHNRNKRSMWFTPFIPCVPLSLAFSLLVGASSFQSPRSPALRFFYLYLFLLRVFSYNITPPQFRSSNECPLTAIFPLLCLQSFSPHQSRLSCFSLMFTTPVLVPIYFVLIFSILFIPIIHLNILISLLSSPSCSAFLSAHVSLPYIRSELMYHTVIMRCKQPRHT